MKRRGNKREQVRRSEHNSDKFESERSRECWTYFKVTFVNTKSDSLTENLRLPISFYLAMLRHEHE